jgi:hypothetical protein
MQLGVVHPDVFADFEGDEEVEDLGFALEGLVRGEGLLC